MKPTSRTTAQGSEWSAARPDSNARRFCRRPRAARREMPLGPKVEQEGDRARSRPGGRDPGRDTEAPKPAGPTRTNVGPRRVPPKLRVREDGEPTKAFRTGRSALLEAGFHVKRLKRSGPHESGAAQMKERTAPRRSAIPTVGRRAIPMRRKGSLRAGGEPGMSGAGRGRTELTARRDAIPAERAEPPGASRASSAALGGGAPLAAPNASPSRSPRRDPWRRTRRRRRGP